jgi:hypothetical protein
VREYTVYWVVVVRMPGQKVRSDDDIEAVTIPSYEKRFEFHGELAEVEAQECRRKAKAAGLEARVTKAKPVQSSWTPELA